MPTEPVELILLRQFATYVTMAMLVISADGGLVFFNDAAAELLDAPLGEWSEMTADEFNDRWRAQVYAEGALNVATLTGATALNDDRPVHMSFDVLRDDAPERRLEATAHPLVGRGGLRLGVVVILWERS